MPWHLTAPGHRLGNGLPAAHHQFRASLPDHLTAMADPQLTPRTPLLLRSAAWRLVGAALISAVLIALWRWALSGGGAA